MHTYQGYRRACPDNGTESAFGDEWKPHMHGLPRLILQRWHPALAIIPDSTLIRPEILPPSLEDAVRFLTPSNILSRVSGVDHSLLTNSDCLVRSPILDHALFADSAWLTRDSGVEYLSLLNLDCLSLASGLHRFWTVLLRTSGFDHDFLADLECLRLTSGSVHALLNASDSLARNRGSAILARVSSVCGPVNPSPPRQRL